MPLLFTCPHCQTQTLVEDRYSGHAGRCVSCSQSIQVPFFSSAGVIQTPTARGIQSNNALLRVAMAVSLGLVTVVSLIVGFFFYGLPAFQEFSQMQERVGTMRNIEKIANAMAAYAVDHGTYPPAIIRDSSGAPMHSWRVLLLPYLNQTELHDQYDFNKPWNAPENSLLASQMPDVFFSQASQGGQAYEACYQLVTGPNTLNPSTGPLKPDAYLDDPAKTALVVEAYCGSSGMVTTGNWLEPTELDITKMTGRYRCDSWCRDRWSHHGWRCDCHSRRSRTFFERQHDARLSTGDSYRQRQ